MGGDAFYKYVWPRLKKSGGAAYQEVMRMMEAGRSFGDAVLDAIESLPEEKTRSLRQWVEEANIGKREMWPGIDSLESRLNKMHNKLAYIIVPSPGRKPTPQRDLDDIEEAIKTVEWLQSMKPPRSAKRWHDNQIAKFEGMIDRAFAAMKKQSEQSESS